MSGYIIKTNGYHTFRYGNLRIQLYYPCIQIKNRDILIRTELCFRVVWERDYKGAGFACLFGIGFDYYKEAPEPT